MDRAMELLLLALVAESCIPAGISLIAIRKLSVELGLSIAAWILAVVLQLVFVVRVGNGTLPLTDSLKFAGAGIPCVVISLTMAARTYRLNSKPYGLVISAFICLFIWFALITLH